MIGAVQAFLSDPTVQSTLSSLAEQGVQMLQSLAEQGMQSLASLMQGGGGSGDSSGGDAGAPPPVCSSPESLLFALPSICRCSRPSPKSESPGQNDSHGSQWLFKHPWG